MDFVYIGIILFIAVVITCLIVYFRKDDDGLEENTFMAKKNERDEFRGRKILCIGNSYGDDSVKYVREIAENLGYKNVVIANLYIGGCTLETHYNNMLSGAKRYEYRKNDNGEWITRYETALDEGILDEDWDIIIMQQQSSRTASWSTYQPYLNELKAHVKQLRPNALLGFNMTWAYPSCSQSTEFAQFDNSQENMYSRITSVISTRIDTDCDFYCVIPTGTAVQNARALVGETLHRDNIHLNEKGRFLASLCWVKEIFGANVNDLSYAPDFVSRELADAFIEAVNCAYAFPFYVTAKR